MYIYIFYNIETKYDPYYNFKFNKLHQALHYNQIYKKKFYHDHNFKTIIIIKDIWIRISNILGHAPKRIDMCGPSYEVC
jgi:hypothetical protein